MGAADETFDRYVGGPRGVHLSEPELESVAGGPQLQYAHVYAFLFVVERTEDGNLLFETQGATPGAEVHD